MFARYFIQLPLPAAEVEAALLSRPQEWLPGLARDAEAWGECLMAEVGFGVAGLRLERLVKVELGQEQRFPTKTLLPIRWRSEGLKRWFPALDADLEVAALGPDRTQLAVSATYQPPLGLVGRAVDRALFHRVAEATLKDFLDRVARNISDRMTDGDLRRRAVERQLVEPNGQG